MQLVLFYPESVPGTNKEKGTGLGLILCKDFVEKHGGHIWAESELAKGCVLKYMMPLSDKLFSAGTYPGK